MSNPKDATAANASNPNDSLLFWLYLTTAELFITYDPKTNVFTKAWDNDPGSKPAVLDRLSAAGVDLDTVLKLFSDTYQPINGNPISYLHAFEAVRHMFQNIFQPSIDILHLASTFYPVGDRDCPTLAYMNQRSIQ